MRNSDNHITLSSMYTSTHYPRRVWPARGVLACRHGSTALDLRAETVIITAGGTETPVLLRKQRSWRAPTVWSKLRAASGHHAVRALRRGCCHVSRHAAKRLPYTNFTSQADVLIEATATPQGMGLMVFSGYGTELLG